MCFSISGGKLTTRLRSRSFKVMLKQEMGVLNEVNLWAGLYMVIGLVAGTGVFMQVSAIHTIIISTLIPPGTCNSFGLPHFRI